MRKNDKINTILHENRQYSTINGCRCFLEKEQFAENSAGTGLLAFIQTRFKKVGKIYYFLVSLFGPVLSSSYFRKQIKEHLNIYSSNDSVIVNIGSGPQYFYGRKDIINIDLFPFEEVDIVADATDLPIRAGSVDFVINIAMLEHTQEPDLVVSEMERILKPGGKVLAYVPFIVPFHAAPYDFQRWTQKGAINLFCSFQSIAVGVGSGPTSGLLYVLQSWLAILLSCGSKTLFDLFFLLIMVLLSPVKLLDCLLEKISFSSIIASGFLVTGSKG